MSKPTQATLAQRAARNFPHCKRLQGEWMRAVGVVRATKRGWVCDLKVLRQEQA